MKSQQVWAFSLAEQVSEYILLESHARLQLACLRDWVGLHPLLSQTHGTFEPNFKFPSSKQCNQMTITITIYRPYHRDHRYRHYRRSYYCFWQWPSQSAQHVSQAKHLQSIVSNRGTHVERRTSWSPTILSRTKQTGLTQRSTYRT